jgi:hypothetical protein
MAGKKARGSWDSNDKRTKAGKSTSTYHPHKDFDAALGMIGSLFGAGRKKAKKTK